MPKKNSSRTTAKKTGVFIHVKNSSHKLNTDNTNDDKNVRKDKENNNSSAKPKTPLDKIKSFTKIPRLPEDLSLWNYLDAAEMISVLTNVNKSGLTLLESAAIYGVQTGLLEDIYAKVAIPDLLSLVADAIYRLVHISEVTLLHLTDQVLDCGRLVKLLTDEQRTNVMKMEVPIKEVEGDYSLGHHIVNHRCHRIFKDIGNEFEHPGYLATALAAHYAKDYQVNVLSFAASIGSIETIQYAYQKMDIEKFLVLLAQPGWRGYNSIHNAIHHGQPVIDILSMLAVVDRGQLLLLKDEESLPVLCYCMKYHKDKAFDAILRQYRGKYSELINVVTYDETLEMSIVQYSIRQDDPSYLQKILKATFSPWKAEEFQNVLKNIFSPKNTGFGERIKEQFGEFVKHVQEELGSFNFLFSRPL